MTRFLDVRASPVGDYLAHTVAINQGTAIGNYAGMSLDQLISDIRGRHVLIGTHGFNVDRENGIACLSNWESLLQLVAPSVFVGLLWPGDSVWLHGLDYPDEPRVANETAGLIAPFIDANFTGAASISFASHSLGARVVLETVGQMKMPVRRVVLMAGAIDDDCLNTEFQQAAARIGEISVLASKQDLVLAAAFPLGNFFAGIITAGHPWFHGALGRDGPSSPLPSNFGGPYEIPSNWNFGHGDYLRVSGPPPAVVPVPAIVPPGGSLPPAGGGNGWHEAWSAAFASTRFE
jgi:alpha/beta hydrolase family protein DUF900